MVDTNIEGGCGFGFFGNDMWLWIVIIVLILCCCCGSGGRRGLCR